LKRDDELIIARRLAFVILVDIICSCCHKVSVNLTSIFVSQHHSDHYSTLLRREKLLLGVVAFNFDLERVVVHFVEVEVLHVFDKRNFSFLSVSFGHHEKHLSALKVSLVVLLDCEVAVLDKHRLEG